MASKIDLNHGCARLIISVCAANDLLRNETAYCLATTYLETGGTMQPVRETFATSDKQAIARLDAAWAKGQLKWVKSPYWRDGWFGRGFCQLTHKDNYERAGRKLGIDLVSNPSKAMVPEVAAKILVRGMQEGWFTGKKLSDYITLYKSDFKGARRIINGTDKAALIAGYAEQYDALLKAEGYGSSPAEPANQPAKEPAKPALPAENGTVTKLPPDNSKLPAKNVFLAWLIDLALAIFGRKPK